jgi:cytochrome P450
MPLTCATRDDRQFDDADVVRIDRAANRHAAFGLGPHRCLGSHLARAELVIALEEWHRRIPDYRLDGIEPEEIVEHSGGGVLGVERLPLSWS